MKKFLGFLTLIAFAVAFASCNTPEGPVDQAPIIIDDAAVGLADKEFGMYYGDMGHNGIGVYSIVLSDAVCHRDGYGDPYLDSEGDMLVLEFNSQLQDADAPIMIPEGRYVIDATKSGTYTINVAKSYIKRLVGSIQYHYDLVSGAFVVGRNSQGGYDIYTEELIIAKGSELYSVQYSYNGNIMLDDWNKIAASLQTIKDDIIDIPFTDVSAVYYGNLFGYGTGNYVLSFSTAGFMEDETGKVPGVALVMNMFGEIVPKDREVILLEEGTYTVYPSFNATEFSMLFGLNMDGMPFGTYLAQVDGNQDQVLEFIGNGTVEVTRESIDYNDVYTIKYDLVTPTRKVQGTWVGPLDFINAAEDSGRVILSTLDGDVECDMHRVEKASLRHIETLKTTPQPSVDIAEAWQLWLQPRMWTEEEKELPWDERIEAWDPNGDIMIFEFVVPLGENGNIAPEINKEYSYQIQPNLAMDEQLYDLSVSQMGRPYDDIFYEPNWKDYTYMTGTDARRGFTWDGGFRGNWYLHYAEGTWQNMDEMAPAVKGTVKVTRLTEFSVASGGGRQADFKIVWDLYDDAEASYNITGEWTGPVTTHTSAEL
ncbi:MAG: hypothetical protein J6Q37_09030 [Bacteroidales bacterium]|nr:hypothetical protein [Bacteroidales bacterium]